MTWTKGFDVSMVSGQGTGTGTAVPWHVWAMGAAVERTRPVVGPVSYGVSAWGEPLPPKGDPQDAAQARLEVRASMFLSAEELLGALWDTQMAWELEADGVALTPDLVRYYALTTLLMSGGPQGPSADRMVAQAYRAGAAGDAQDRDFFERARREIAAAFGMMPRPATSSDARSSW
ncbi:hypothetical protein ACFYXL_33875 [Streptomyces tsukubensis]|uniref:hypothetical protein n=1 Tax=Streptomyces tsukubensis TaxID=83656 RepID=UPI003685C7F5